MRNKVVIKKDRKDSLKVGMIFQFLRDGDFYIIHRSGSLKYSLVCLHDGYPWSSSCDVIEDVFGDDRGAFALFVGELTITTNCE